MPGVPMLRARTPEEAARRRFGLWALAALIVLLPLWWVWGADLAAAVLRPVAQAWLGLFSLGAITPTPEAWAIDTGLTSGGQALDYSLPRDVVRRILLSVPLTAAFFLAPPWTDRPVRAALISLVVVVFVFLLSLVVVVWGDLAPMLNAALASASTTPGPALDQPPLGPVQAQVAVIGRYVALSVAPLITAAVLWASLNPRGLKALAAEIEG